MRSCKYFLYILSFMFLSSCAVNYSFTGGSINYEETKSINIFNFYSKVASGPADLSLRFTEDLKEFIQQRTKLEVTNKQSDLQLEGFVSYYDISPVGATSTSSGDEFAALNRLTIKVSVKYTNFKDPSQDYTEVFSSPNDLTYEQGESLVDVEDDLIEVAFDQIKQDIYNRCFSNW